MVIVQWNIHKVSRKWLEDCGWKFVRQVTEEWIEMCLGEEDTSWS